MENKLPVISSRDKWKSFFYVSLQFTFFSTLCCVILFAFNVRWGFTARKDTVRVKMEVSRKFQQEQTKASLLISELHEKIDAYEPGVNAHYEKDNINYLLSEIRNIYAQNPSDSRYRAFLHVADFYEMWYEDKRTGWALEENNRKFSTYLRDCEMGVSSKRNNLSGWR